MSLDLDGLLFVSESLGFLLLELLLVDCKQVSAHLSNLLLACDFPLFFSFEVLFCLTLDELAFKHFLLNLLNVAKFEVLELVAQVFSVLLSQFILFLKLGSHLFVVFLHLGLFNFFPVLLNFTIDLALAIT